MAFVLIKIGIEILHEASVELLQAAVSLRAEQPKYTVAAILQQGRSLINLVQSNQSCFNLQSNKICEHHFRSKT